MDDSILDDSVFDMDSDGGSSDFVPQDAPVCLLTVPNRLLL